MGNNMNLTQIIQKQTISEQKISQINKDTKDEQTFKEVDIEQIQIIDNPKWDILNSKLLQANYYSPNNLQIITLKSHCQSFSRRSQFIKIESILLNDEIDKLPDIQTDIKTLEINKINQNKNSLKQINLINKKSEQVKQTDEISQKKRNYNHLKINIESFVFIKNLNVEKYYKFINKIGQGSFGNVYKALCLRTNQFRAIKILKKSKQSPKQNINKQFQKKLTQLQILSKLDHPNIIKLYEAYFYNDNYYLITQFCAGGSIISYFKNCQIYNQKIVKQIMIQVLKALSYLHEMRIAHRDIKIENIMLLNQIRNQMSLEEIQIKIIDFGESLSLKLKHNNKDRKEVGTVIYTAPQAIDGYYSQFTDIWSCGVLFYILMTGIIPFSKATKQQTFQCIKKKQINFNDPSGQEIPLTIKQLITKMLSKDPLKRITAKQALKNSWFSQNNSLYVSQKMKLVAQKLKNYHQTNDFISLIDQYLIFLKLSQEQKAEMGKIFRQIDKDNSGNIDVNELKLTFNKYQGLNAKETNFVEQIIQKIDKNNNKKIDLNEFMTVLFDRKTQYLQSELLLVFDHFDIDRNNQIDKKQLRSILKGCQNQQIQQILIDLDMNNDQKISKDQFINYIKRQSALAFSY